MFLMESGSSFNLMLVGTSYVGTSFHDLFGFCEHRVLYSGA